MGYDVSALARECFGCHVCVGDTVPLLLSSLGIARDLTESTHHATQNSPILGATASLCFFFCVLMDQKQASNTAPSH